MQQRNLDAMIGKTYLINGKRRKIVAAKLIHSEDGQQAMIVTEKNEMTAFTDDALKQFLPAAPEVEVNLQILPKHDNTLGNLRTTVLASIEKLKVDKKYIDQAVAINGSINVIIQMAKLELEAHKLLNKID